MEGGPPGCLAGAPPARGPGEDARRQVPETVNQSVRRAAERGIVRKEAVRGRLQRQPGGGLPGHHRPRGAGVGGRQGLVGLTPVKRVFTSHCGIAGSQNYICGQSDDQSRSNGAVRVAGGLCVAVDGGARPADVRADAHRRQGREGVEGVTRISDGVIQRRFVGGFGRRRGARLRAVRVCARRARTRGAVLQRERPEVSDREGQQSPRVPQSRTGKGRGEGRRRP